MGFDAQARASIDALVFVSQQPDYFFPATACILQHRLGLATQCAAYDVNQGCSAYTYGLWQASALLESGAVRRVLLLLFVPAVSLGAVWWLFEQRVLGALALALFVAGLLVLYRLGLQAWAPRWQHAWFAELALALFALLWWLRHRLRAPAWVLGLSELTYAVYLLHTWLFDIGRDALLAAGAGRAAADLAGVAGVLATSWLLVRLVERPSIALGRRLARPLGRRPGLRRA